jgi:hypothetical protein
VRKEECVEKVGKNLNCFAKSSDLKHAYLSELPMILLMYKEAYLTLIIWIPVFLMLLEFFYKNLKMSFHKRFLVACRQLKELNIRSTFFQEHLEAIPKSLRNSNGKWRS